VSIILPPFREERLLYTRQASSKVKSAARYVTKLPYYFTIPVFSIENTWRGSSEIIRKYYYSFEKSFSILEYIDLSSDGNYIPCISWKDENNNVLRYKLWYKNDGLLYIPPYNGKVINKNFYLEIWSTNNALIEGGGKQLKISQFKFPIILCETGEIDLAPVYNTCNDMSFDITNFDPLSGDYYTVINTCLDTQQTFGVDAISISIDEFSTIDNIILNIDDPDSIPDLYEIYRSIDGINYNLIYTQLTSITFNDESLMPPDTTWYYKVRSKKNGVYSQFSNIQIVTRNVTFPGVGIVNFSNLVLAFSDLGSDDGTLVSSLSLSDLKRVVGTLWLDGSFILESINLSSLHIINGDFHIEASPLLTELNLLDLTIVNGNFYADNCENLTNINFPNFIFSNNTTLAFDACDLSVASVNHILARAIVSGVINCQIFLDGGTNAAPTGQGIIDRDALIAAGNTVSSN